MAPAPLVLTGTVTDPSGRPVAGARVALAAGPAPVPDVAALTGDDGGFSFGVPVPGSYRVEAFADQGGAGRSVEVLPEGTEPLLLVLTAR